MRMAKNSLRGLSFDQIMIQQAQKSIESPIYCRFCGKNVKEPTIHSYQEDWRKYLDWEIQNHAHVKCAQKAVRRR